MFFQTVINLRSNEAGIPLRSAFSVNVGESEASNDTCFPKQETTGVLSAWWALSSGAINNYSPTVFRPEEGVSHMTITTYGD